MRSARPWLVLALLAALAGCASAPPTQRVEIRTDPPGASVFRIEGPAPGLPAVLAGAVTPSAEDVERAPVGRTPLVYEGHGEKPYRLRIELADHAPYEIAVPGRELEAHVDVALVATGALAQEDAALEAILGRGPLTAEEIAREAGGEAALAGLRAKELVERVRVKPDTFDLSERGVGRLRQRLGDSVVAARLIESRRALFRAGRRP
jgi:hypothetical protein